MKNIILLLSFLTFTSLFANSVSAKENENLCGWYDNPTPGNATLLDKNGEWLIAQQGNFEAKGNWNPTFNQKDEKEFVQTNGSYGYGCV